MAEIVLGIEFGSSNVTISKKDEGLILKTPNVIAVKKDYSDNFVVEEIGEKAKNLIGKTDDRIAVFSPVCNGEIVSEKYATIMLKTLLDNLNIKRGIFSKLKIIITVPVGITQEQKKKYIDLCCNVGAKEVICIPKVFCSALGEKINIGANNAKLIVDVGGGTVDCAVINLNTIISGSTLEIGGKTMDSTIIDYIKQNFNTVIGEKTAQQIKEQIGSLYPNDNAHMVVNGVRLADNTPNTLTVTAKEVYEATHMFFDEVVKIIRATINSLEPEISADVVRNGIYVCGGYAKTVGLDKYIKNQLGGISVFISYDCESSICKGINKLLSHEDMLENILINL